MKEYDSLTPIGRPLWDTDPRNIGKNMLEKMGWSYGQGLGKFKNGSINPLRPKSNWNNKGLGFTLKDKMTENYEAFESALEELNKANSAENDTEGSKWQKHTSQYKKFKIRYHKFLKGKDISNYSFNDLNCILGKRKKTEDKSKSSEELYMQYSFKGMGSMMDPVEKENFNKIKSFPVAAWQEISESEQISLQKSEESYECNISKVDKVIEIDSYANESVNLPSYIGDGIPKHNSSDYLSCEIKQKIKKRVSFADEKDITNCKETTVDKLNCALNVKRSKGDKNGKKKSKFCNPRHKIKEVVLDNGIIHNIDMQDTLKLDKENNESVCSILHSSVNEISISSEDSCIPKNTSKVCDGSDMEYVCINNKKKKKGENVELSINVNSFDISDIESTDHFEQDRQNSKISHSHGLNRSQHIQANLLPHSLQADKTGEAVSDETFCKSEDKFLAVSKDNEDENHDNSNSILSNTLLDNEFFSCNSYKPSLNTLKQRRRSNLRKMYLENIKRNPSIHREFVYVGSNVSEILGYTRHAKL